MYLHLFMQSVKSIKKDIEMRKTLIATAILAMGGVGTAFATSNVTLYGVIDTGIQVENVEGGGSATPTKVSMNTGFNSGSRWGIKGVEDLGNGYSVGFVLEQGFKSDNGKADDENLQFRRESQMYVAGDFGKVGFGRFGSLASGTGSYSMLGGWALGTSYGAGSLNSMDGTNRLDNAIVYVSPNFGGFTVSAMYSNNTQTDDDGKSIDDNKNKWSKNDHYYGIGATYKNAGLAANLIFEVNDYKGTAAEVGAEIDKRYQVDLGISYDLEGVTPMFAYRYMTQNDYGEVHQFALSAKAPLAGGTAKVGVRYRIEKADGAFKELLKNTLDKDDGSVWTVNAAYEYPLSKRTTVYGYAGYADGKDLLSHAYKDNVNYNGWQTAVGIVHKF